MITPGVHFVWRGDVFSCDHQNEGACSSCAHDWAGWMRYSGALRHQLTVLLDEIVGSIWWDKDRILAYKSEPLLRAIDEYNELKNDLGDTK